MSWEGVFDGAGIAGWGLDCLTESLLILQGRGCLRKLPVLWPHEHAAKSHTETCSIFTSALS